MRGLAETLGAKFGERGVDTENRDRETEPAETDPKRDGKRSYEPAEEKVDRRHQKQGRRGLPQPLQSGPFSGVYLRVGLTPKLGATRGLA